MALASCDKQGGTGTMTGTGLCEEDGSSLINIRGSLVHFTHHQTMKGCDSGLIQKILAAAGDLPFGVSDRLSSVGGVGNGLPVRNAKGRSTSSRQNR